MTPISNKFALSRKKELLFTALLFFLLAYLLPIAFRPLIRPDEFRYAEVAREMLVSGNWVAPRLDGMRYFEKPALGYQLTAVSFKIFGLNAFALRFPPALATGLTALLLALFRRREQDGGVLAAIFFLTFAMVWGVGTFAVLDAQLNFFITATILSIYAAERSGGLKTELFLLVIAGISAGFGALIKGLPGIAVPALVGGGYLLWQKRWSKIAYYLPVIGIVTLLVVLPWALLVHRQEPDFWRYFLIEEHWHRYTGRTYDRKPQPWWFFIPFLAGGILPAGIAFFLKKIQVTALKPETPVQRLLLLWAVLPFLLFSAGSCKLGTYILPCFPPLAIMLSALISGNGVPLPSRCSEQTLCRIAGIVLLTAGAAAIIIFPLQSLVKFYPAQTSGYFPLYLGLILAACGLLAFRLGNCGNLRRLQGFTLVFAVLVNSVCLLMPSGFYLEKATEDRIKECLAAIPLNGNEVIFADKNLITPLCWTLKNTGIIVLGRPGELEYARNNHPAEYRERFCELREFQGHPAILGKKPAAVFYLAKKKRPLPEDLPTPELSVQSGNVALILYNRQ